MYKAISSASTRYEAINKPFPLRSWSNHPWNESVGHHHHFQPRGHEASLPSNSFHYLKFARLSITWSTRLWGSNSFMKIVIFVQVYVVIRTKCIYPCIYTASRRHIYHCIIVIRIKYACTILQCNIMGDAWIFLKLPGRPRRIITIRSGRVERCGCLNIWEASTGFGLSEDKCLSGKVWFSPKYFLDKTGRAWNS